MDFAHEDTPEPTAAEARAAAWRPPADKLDGRVVVYWYATDIFRALAMAAIVVAGSWYWGEKDPQQPEWIQPASYWLAGAILFLALVVPPLAYARWRYSVDDQLLAMRYGILFVEERLVPVPRMQHVDLMRGPIERLFGLATLVVFTAGNEGSAFRVPGLSRRRAESIRDGILEARGHDFT